MERQTGFYILISVFVGLLTTVYFTFIKTITVTSFAYDAMITLLFLSIAFLLGLCVVEKFGYPSMKVVREYVQWMSSIFLLWIIVLIISCFI